MISRKVFALLIKDTGRAGSLSLFLVSALNTGQTQYLDLGLSFASMRERSRKSYEAAHTFLKY